MDSGGQPLREGDRVTFVYFFPCGRCPVCLRDEMGGCPRKGRANRVAGTPPYFNNAYGDYYYLRPGAFVFRVPDEVSDDVVTPANCALAQVIYGLARAGLRPASPGLQGAGRARAQRGGGRPRHGRRPRDRARPRRRAPRAGPRLRGRPRAEPDDLPTPERRIEAIQELTGGFGADVVADFVGYPEVVPEGLRMLRGGGCYLEVGSISPGNVFSYDATALVRASARLVATSNYSPWALARALAFLKRNLPRFPFERLVSHVYPLARIGKRSARPTGCRRAATASASPGPRCP